MEAKQTRSRAEITFEAKIIFFGTIVAEPNGPIIVSDKGFNIAVRPITEDTSSSKLTIHKENLTRLEYHFCHTLAVMYIAIDAECSQYIRKALGIDSGKSERAGNLNNLSRGKSELAGNFNNLSRNSCHTKIMIALESADWEQSAKFVKFMLAPNISGKGNFIFTELNHTSALSGYSVLKKVVNKDNVPSLPDRCVAQRIGTMGIKNTEDKGQKSPVMLQVSSHGVEPVSHKMVSETSKGWQAVQNLPRNSNGYIKIVPKSKETVPQKKRKLSVNVEDQPTSPSPKEAAVENNPGLSLVITNVTSLASDKESDKGVLETSTSVSERTSPKSHPIATVIGSLQEINSCTNNNNNECKSPPIQPKKNCATMHHTLGVSLSAVVMSLGPFKGIPLSFVDVYDSGMNIWFHADSPPRNITHFNGHLAIPGQDIIRCLSYFHEEASSGLILYITPVFSSILYNILNSHAEFNAYLDETDRLNSYNVSSILLGPVDSIRSVQVQHKFLKLSAKSPFGPLLSMIDYSTVSAFLKSCFGSTPEVTSSNLSAQNTGHSRKENQRHLSVGKDTVELMEEEMPDQFTCPYSLKTMQDPVQNIHCKHNYDRKSIIHYMFTPKRSEHLCPVMGCPNKITLAVADLEPNEELREKILKKFSI